MSYPPYSHSKKAPPFVQNGGAMPKKHTHPSRGGMGRGFLRLLRTFYLRCRWSHLLEAHIVQLEILAVRQQPHHRLGDVCICDKRLVFRHHLALERGHQRAQVAELNRVAVRHNLAGSRHRFINHCCHFALGERSVLRRAMAELSKRNPFAMCRNGSLHLLTLIGTESHFAQSQKEL